MNSIVQYSVNIAMEATIIVFLVLMLVTCFWQKKLFATTSTLRFLVGGMILTLVNQIVTWSLLLNDAQIIYGAMPFRIVYILDYILYYGVSVALYYYVEALVKEGYKSKDITYTPNKKCHMAIFIWGAVTTLIYGAMLFEPSVFRVENGTAVYSMVAFACLHLIILFACICAMALIIRHRRVIGRHEAILCFTFVILASAFSIVDELCGLCISYVLMSLFILILYLRIDLHKGLILERQKKEITEWKTQIMLSQMQPHFLYNVLTTISSLCEMQDAIEARDVVNHFADYFRTNLDSMGKDKLIPFEKELEHVKTYLWLEKIRFEDSLNIIYEIEATDFNLPSLTIQPMVENAIKHGIRPKEGTGTVCIKTYETNDNYLIEIEDDGVGFNPNSKPDDNRIHVGIENVTKRLEVICNGTCKIDSQAGKGTKVTISIPKGD